MGSGREWRKGSNLPVKRIRHVLSEGPAVLYCCKACANFDLTFISENVKFQLGYDPNELIEPSTAWVDGIHPEDRKKVLEEFASLTKKRMFISEYRFLHKNGTYRWVRNEARLLTDRMEKPIEVVGFLTDVTERKKMEEALQSFDDELERRIRERTEGLEEAKRQLESFCYSVSHDLRTPLLVISGLARTLMEKHAAKLDDRGKQYLTVIRNNAENSLHLIDDLLAFSRVSKQPLRLSVIDMEELARSLFEQLRDLASGHSVRFELKHLPPARGDPTMIRQVLTNLISNALKFTRPRREAFVEVGSIVKENQTVYYVRDNGVGFDMGEAGRLFGAFQRLHDPAEFEGSGVGLAIVRCIVERHGGWVWAEGKVNEGATFYFTLPR